MKIELIKKEKMTPSGVDVLYIIEKDGIYVPDSATSSFEKAEVFYKYIASGMEDKEVSTVIRQHISKEN
jgi:phage tail sheath gpL-like